MFKALLARITEDDNPRLHRIPFMFIWVTAFGLGWFSLLIGGMLLSDIDSLYWLQYDGQWLLGLILGSTFGAILALIQGWAVRRRYGFVPRFWRLATIIGMAFASMIFLISDNPSAYNDFLWQGGTLWLLIFGVFQAAVLFRVNRQSWLLIIVALIASATALLFITAFGMDYGIIWAILGISAIQAIGSGIVMLRLMANPREGIVPKRDSDSKAKTRIRSGLHPFTFIGFWMAAYLMGWVALFVSMAIWFTTVGEIGFVRDFIWWLESNAEWALGVTMGSIVGLISSLAQPWLMQQHSKTTVRHWVLLSTMGWAIGGLGFYNYVNHYNATELERILSLMVWFGAPALFQTYPIWRAMRGGWMWVGTGLATAVIALLIETQFSWTYNETFYAIMFGSVAQAIITGSAFIVLQSQQAKLEQDQAALAA